MAIGGSSLFARGVPSVPQPVSTKVSLAQTGSTNIKVDFAGPRNVNVFGSNGAPIEKYTVAYVKRVPAVQTVKIALAAS